VDARTDGHPVAVDEHVLDRHRGVGDQRIEAVPRLGSADIMRVVMDAVVRRFKIGQWDRRATPVSGGLSNELWRVVTDSGTYAVKRLVAGADRPEFVANIEASFAIERRAYLGGVPMPRFVPDPLTNCAFARINGSFVRVHEWADEVPGPVSATEALGLLGCIHAAGTPRYGEIYSGGWRSDRWGAELAGLADLVAEQVPDRALIVDSHRDLDRKNVLRTAAGATAVDWDAAGAVRVAQEVVAVAFDWAGDSADTFLAAIDSYRTSTGLELPAEPWVFGAWVASQGEWLDYNADQRSDTDLGQTEIGACLRRLQMLAHSIHSLVAALR
jgi:hypothetical protein